MRALSLVLAIATLPALQACDGDGDDQQNNNQIQIITRDDALKGCIIADACGVMPYGFATLCVQTIWDQAYHTATVPIWSELYRCINDAAPDCTAVAKCLSQGETPESCLEVTDGYCDGDVRVFCDTYDRKLYKHDCALANQSCVMSEVTTGTLAPVCAGGACDSSVDLGRCQGNLLLSCEQDAYLLRDCSALGLVCGEGKYGGMACVGTGEACDDMQYEVTCEGFTIDRCVHNKVNIFNCGNLPGNQTCDPVREDCGYAGTECDNADESCTGTVMYLCVDGFVTAIDCVDLGFAGCTIRGGAHCTR